jgi:glutamyl-Q tRNA(Asp) synthetase
LVRIEDIDPPREMPGASADILRTLEHFGLEWDGTVLYQSTRREAYSAAALRLLASRRAFRCNCSRSLLRSAHGGQGGRYPGTCRTKRLPPGDSAVRALVEPQTISFNDGLQGAIATRLDQAVGDYVVWRRDGLPAYHLAVVVDDAEQGVTTVVRGIDLLDSTPVHIHLQRALDLGTPRYFHAPVIVNEARQKLSKQTGAAAVMGRDVRETASAVLGLLGLRVPTEVAAEPPHAQWRWAAGRWRIDALSGRQMLAEPR